jgi:hypothetical protein
MEMATLPSPPAPAWMSTLWPRCRLAYSASDSHAVRLTSGSAAAVSKESSVGLRAIDAAFTGTNSA